MDERARIFRTNARYVRYLADNKYVISFVHPYDARKKLYVHEERERARSGFVGTKLGTKSVVARVRLVPKLLVKRNGEKGVGLRLRSPAARRSAFKGRSRLLYCRRRAQLLFPVGVLVASLLSRRSKAIGGNDGE